VSWEDSGGEAGDKLLVQDVIADAMLQQVLTRPGSYDVIATTNLNGDYLSDALAAQVGGIGIAPGGNINYDTGVAIFEATHGTAPKYAGQDKVNPGSVILSGEMMFRYMGMERGSRPDRQGASKGRSRQRRSPTTSPGSPTTPPKSRPPNSATPSSPTCSAPLSPGPKGLGEGTAGRRKEAGGRGQLNPRAKGSP
jgi:hypothetical protein